MTVYDIFSFNNELDLLDIRLNTLKDIVDIFILTESAYTFSGKKKPLYFRENYERFKYTNCKVMNIVIDGSMPFKKHTFNKKERRTNEYVQRNIFSNHVEFNDDDVLFIGDVDEIPHPHIVDVINEGFNQPIRLKQKFYYYYMNCRCEDDWVTGTVLLKGKDFTNFDDIRRRGIGLIAEPGGWHFSYLGDIEEKIGNLVEVEFDLDKYRDEYWIKYCVENGVDLFERDIKWYFEDTTDLPQYVKDNMDKFDKYIYKGEK